MMMIRSSNIIIVIIFRLFIIIIIIIMSSRSSSSSSTKTGCGCRCVIMNISIIIIIILIRSSSRSSTSVRGMGSKLRWNTISTNGFDSGRRGTRTCELLKWAEVTGTGDWWRLGGAPCAGKWPSNATMLLFIIISIAPSTSTTPVNRCVKQRFHWLRRWWCWWWLSQVKKNGGASQKIPELSWFRFDLEVMQQANIKLWAKLSLKRNSKKHGVFEETTTRVTVRWRLVVCWRRRLLCVGGLLGRLRLIVIVFLICSTTRKQTNPWFNSWRNSSTFVRGVDQRLSKQLHHRRIFMAAAIIISIRQEKGFNSWASDQLVDTAAVAEWNIRNSALFGVWEISDFPFD